LIFQETSHIYVIVQLYKTNGPNIRPRLIGDLVWDKSLFWGYFDGICQHEEAFYGIGRVIFIHEKYYIELNYNIGQGTNNHTELLAL